MLTPPLAVFPGVAASGVALARHDTTVDATSGGTLVVGQGASGVLVLVGLARDEDAGGGNREHAAAGRQASGE